jgi:Putative DNA-binding domain
MGKSLFTSPLATIDVKDVIAFCEQAVAESVNLDYKREIPAGDKLAKTVTSFANTFGGVVLLGVDEDDRSRPKPPFVGMTYEPKLEERIWSILIENTYPPVLPEIQICAPENDRTFVVIRVAQSATTPHAVRHNTSVFLRTGNITKPELLERLATIEEVDWLKDRRRRSEEFRQTIISSIRARRHILSIVRRLQLATKPEVEVWLGPKYPSEPLLAPRDLEDRRKRRGLYVDRVSEDLRVHDGVASALITKDMVGIYAETNVFGYTLVAVNLETPDMPTVVSLSSIIGTMAEVVRFATTLLPAVGYWGVCQLSVTLRGVAGHHLRPLGEHWVGSEKTQLDNELEFRRDIAGPSLSDDIALETLIGEVAATLAWSFGWKIEVDEVTRHLGKSDLWRRSP